MKVTNDRPVHGPQRKVAARVQGRDRFSDLLPQAGEAGEATSTAAAAPVAPADALLSLQEVSGESGRRRAFRRGESLLDQLDAIRIGLLAGILPREKLIRLAQILRETRTPPGDPALAELLAEIELRAEVELAKLSVAR